MTMDAGPVIAGFIAGQEWLILLAVVLLFFGASRVPVLARSLGRSVLEFKQGMKEPAPPHTDGEVGRDGQTGPG